MEDAKFQEKATDEIVSITHGPLDAFRPLGARPKLDVGGPYLRLQFSTIYVRSHERSLHFFQDQLGFVLAADVKFASGARWIEVAPPDGTASLGLVLAESGSAEDRIIGSGGPVAFLTEDVHAKYLEWSARGVTFLEAPQTSVWGGIVCKFEDPDGNRFLLAGFDAVSRQIEEHRRATAERLEAEHRAAQELLIAKQVRARLFPQRCPKIPTLDYAGVCHQARSVGGDYYDFLDLGADRTALVIGDISGKGMAAALLMANLQANLRSQYLSAGDHPERFLRSVNQLLLENTAESSYATLFFLDYDDGSGRLRYANCGHLPGLILRSDGTVDRLGSTSTVLGLFPNWTCLLEESSLDRGDILALYTDGVTESFNEIEEEFGEDRLILAMRRHDRLPASELASAIIDDVLSFSSGNQSDDLTLLVAKRVRD